MKRTHTYFEILAVVGALVALHCGKSPGKSAGNPTSSTVEETVGKDPDGGGDGGGSTGTPEANLTARSLIFKETVHKTLTQYCSGCHAAKSTAPITMAQDDPLEALKEVEDGDGKIDYQLPESSRLVERLSLLSHNCWNRCDDDSKIMLASVKDYISQVDAAKIMPAPETFKDTERVSLSSAVAAPGTELEGTYVKYASMGTGLVAPMAAKTDDKDGIIDTYYATGTANAGEVLYTMNVLEAGTYSVWLKVKNTAAARTLRISVDNAAPVVWTQATSAMSFTWDSVKAAANGPATTFTLQPGPHTVKVLGQALNVKFNTVALTKTLTNFGGDQVVSAVKVITIPLDAVAPGKNSKLIVEVSEFDAKTKTSEIRNIKFVGGPLKIKDLRPVVNGVRRKLWSSYRSVDMTIPATGPEGIIVSRAAQVISGEGFSLDKLSFTFGEIK